MTQDQLLWVIGLTALLTAPSAVLLFGLAKRLWAWGRWQLPPRHLVARGWREVRRNDDEPAEEGAHE
ncbi:hypothetical protein [Pseudomonas knackmussii]|uniref:hypothetical protein n=1 Tax=Pseudomonas knackmussii TaxID=65741 RepID=UPI0013640200|nr:hypothetical protein [Pseudomonas knackmussii]